MNQISQTSLFSFLALQPKLSEKQKEVYEAMRMYGRPFTDHDLKIFMNWEINSITPRRGELLKKGLVRKAGTIMQNGRTATLWEVGIII